MPRLFDLLSDGARKDLITESRKNKKATHKEPPQKALRPHPHAPKPPEIPQIPIPDFVALDVETTGLDFKNDRIIEIGIVKFKQGRMIDEYSTFINPGMPIPTVITDLTGISDADVATAPAFQAIAETLLAFVEMLPLCGHQIEFDASFLREEFKRFGKPAPENQLFDTALLSRLLLDPRGRFSLGYVCGVLDVKLDNAHRALHDARASGEVAVRLIPKIAELPLPVRRTIALCAPASLFKSVVFKSIPNVKPELALEFPGRKPPVRLAPVEAPVAVDRAEVAGIFDDNEKLSSISSSFTPRKAQVEMACGVADALSTGSLYIAEAGTGTGKSLAYLAPAALWATRNRTRVVVSTRTKNLQDQLIAKDLPAAAALCDGKLQYTVLKGRQNYLCQRRFMLLLSGAIGNLSPRERFAILPLIVWSGATQTGDIEEQNLFNPKWFSKIWSIICAEHHECGHRRCSFFGSCFFQSARSAALGSHIVVINHALFFSDMCAGNSLLGFEGPMVFDEAHHLESSGHRFLRVELDTNRINLFADTLNNLVLRVAALQEEKQIYEAGREMRTSLKQFRKKGTQLLDRLLAWAKEKSPPTPDYQIPYDATAFAETAEKGAFLQSVDELHERLQQLRQAVQAHPETEKFEALEAETVACMEQTSQIKADTLYLAAAKTDEHVFWTEGNSVKGWAKLCGVPLDVGALLSDIWERCGGAVVFTSATLSIAGSFDYFKRTTGLTAHAQRTAEAMFKSPFGAHQSIAGAVKPAPEVDSPEFPAYVASVIAALHGKFRKNILVLFTSHGMLSNVYQLLRATPSINKNNLLAQNVSGSRQIILEEFKSSSQMILLGAESFWEGVDVPGEACEMVIIPRLPFPVPTHPLTQAIAQRMQEKEGESFFSYSVPEAVIRFRQGAGRLIRTVADRGALIVLDNRIVNRGYGRQFIRSIDVDFQTFENVEGMMDRIDGFFAAPPGSSQPVNEPRYVPLEDA